MAAFGKVQAENYEFPVFTCPELEEAASRLPRTGSVGQHSARLPTHRRQDIHSRTSGNVPWGNGEPCATGEALGAGVREPVGRSSARAHR